MLLAPLFTQATHWQWKSYFKEKVDRHWLDFSFFLFLFFLFFFIFFIFYFYFFLLVLLAIYNEREIQKL